MERPSDTFKKTRMYLEFAGPGSGVSEMEKSGEGGKVFCHNRKVGRSNIASLCLLRKDVSVLED